MNSANSVWLIPLLALLGGVIVGYIIARLIAKASPQNTQNQLDDLQERFDSYQNEVVAHFSTTAELVNKLTENYQNVQQHLLQSAERLALDDNSRERLLASLLDSPEKARLQAPKAPPAPQDTELPPEPPRDYAPKAEGEVGTLDENFGRQEKE